MLDVKIDWARYFLLRQTLPFEIAWRMAKRPPTVEELQNEYAFTYYSTMSKAVTDVNNGTTANADATKDSAVAGVYTDKNGGKNVVLLKDTTLSARIRPSVDMTINLGGHVLSSSDAVCINVDGGNVTVDGRMSGSTLQLDRASTCAAVQVSKASGAKTIVFEGVKIIANTTSGDAYGINSTSTNVRILVSNCNISATAKGGVPQAVYTKGETKMYGCNLKVTAVNTKTSCITNLGELSASRCSIIATCMVGETYTEDAVAIINSTNCVCTLNDCYVAGIQSGVENYGSLYVNGGTLESYEHGGIYFAGTGTTAYVRNASLKDMVALPEGLDVTSQNNGSAFYIGGAAGNDNISVYMDNCDLYGSIHQGVLRGSSGEKNNSLYISNSRCHDLVGDDISIRIDNNTHKLYLGRGNNFTAEDTTLPEAVIVTDEVYAQGGGS